MEEYVEYRLVYEALHYSKLISSELYMDGTIVTFKHTEKRDSKRIRFKDNMQIAKEAILHFGLQAVTNAINYFLEVTLLHNSIDLERS